MVVNIPLPITILLPFAMNTKEVSVDLIHKIKFKMIRAHLRNIKLTDVFTKQRTEQQCLQPTESHGQFNITKRSRGFLGS